VKLFWNSKVPGSGAPECLMVGAVQASQNKGLNVNEATNLLHEGLDAYNKNNMQKLHMITSLIFENLDNAKKLSDSDYWNFDQINSWKEHNSAVKNWPKDVVDIIKSDFEERILASWLGQICAGAFGTSIEGFSSDTILDAFENLNTYLRTPNTYNDDITYEIAFLEAYIEKGESVTSKDIAAKWVSLIPFGWSAEYCALSNIKLGVFPPKSGTKNNPFSEWIGAQMRGSIAGMISPGDPKKAAKFAWKDGIISHTGNGVLGETFNAMLCSLAFVTRDIRELLFITESLLPVGTQYYSVIHNVLALCKDSTNWKSVWDICRTKYKKYNWVHAYPNATAEVIGLWFGNGCFDRTLEIIAGCGLDVDCNAAQAGAVLGIFGGMDAISDKWKKPIGDVLETYMRGMEELSIRTLAKKTVASVRNSTNSITKG
jgi:ADP-ribosylglycohydrolase